MRAATDADFNAQSRHLALKLEIYFDGLEEAPLTVTKDDYLMDADWLEEGSAESSSPFGSISSNEITFRLFNGSGIFSPTNVSGPYYGLIKSGVCIIPYIKPIITAVDVSWTQLGKFYVSGWTAAITSGYADIVANDIWQKIFNSPTPSYEVNKNVTFEALFTDVFTLMGYSVIVSEELTQTLKYAFIEGSPQQFLQDLTKGAMAYLSCNKAGQPLVNPLIAAKTVRAALTDGDQIISISSKQSITKAYNGTELIYSIPQGITQDKLVELQGVLFVPGDSTLTKIAFNSGPVWQISSILAKSTANALSLLSYNATPWLISLVFNNSKVTTVAGDVLVYGTLVSFTEVVLSDAGVKPLKASSRYVQDAVYAEAYKNILSSFVNVDIPLLTLTIRGNPLLSIGDRVTVQSTKYNLSFDGIIQRLKYEYVGSLSCEMTLLNSSIVLGVY